MKFELSSGRVDIKPLLRSQIERRFLTTFHRLANWIHTVTIHVDDVGGPQKGSDGKQCRIVVTASGVEQVGPIGRATLWPNGHREHKLRNARPNGLYGGRTPRGKK